MIEYTDDQKLQIANKILQGIRSGNDQAILESLESAGYKSPMGDDPNQYYYEEEQRQRQAAAQEYARRQAEERQRRGADYNNSPAVDQLKKEREEFQKLKAEFQKEREALRKNMHGVETAVLSDKFHQRVSSEVEGLKEHFPALKSMENSKIVEMVKQAKHDFYKQNEESIDTEEIMQELNNEMVEYVNEHIDDDEKKLKPVDLKEEDDDDFEDPEIKDESGQVIGTLTKEGVLKTLSNKDTGGSTAPKRGADEAGKKLFDHTSKKTEKEDGTIVLDGDDLDPDKIVDAAINAREAGESSYSEERDNKVQDIINKAVARGGDGDDTAGDQESAATTEE